MGDVMPVIERSSDDPRIDWGPDERLAEVERLQQENNALRAMLDARGVTPATIAGVIAAEGA